MRLRSVALALQPLAQHLTVPPDRLGLLAHPAFRRLFISPPPLHLAKGALPLHLLFEHPQRRIDVIVAHENLHGLLSYNLLRTIVPAKRGAAPNRPLPHPELALLQVDGRGLPSIPALQIEAHLLPFVQVADTGALDRRDVNEHILRAVLRLNKAVTLCGVEPLHGSSSHGSSFKKPRVPPLGSERRVKLQHGAGSRSGARSGAWESKPNHGEPTVKHISPPGSRCNSAALR